MPSRGVWVYNPHSGGKTIPERIRHDTEERIRAFAAEHYAGRYRDLIVRFRGQFCYLDALVDPEPLPSDWRGPSDETAEEYQSRLAETPVHLCRLRFNGDPQRWTFAFFSYASERYEPSVFLTGDHGTPEEAFDLSAGAYLS
ncbi:MAG: hypothetical protein ACYC1D_08680 [Acidimicrobiales bacterium]